MNFLFSKVIHFRNNQFLIYDL